MDRVELAVERGRTPVTSNVTARIDWSMPTSATFEDPADPSGPPGKGLNDTKFAVLLDGCASTPESWGQLVKFEWRIANGVSPEQTVAVSSACSVLVQMEQGTYRMKLIATSAAGFVGETTSDVVVRDYLVVSIGDSVASGEGNPDKVRNGAEQPAAWANLRCHRSTKAGPAKAARALEDADPRSTVTFLSVACSGAGIEEGLLGPYAGITDAAQRPPLPSQIDAVRAALCVDGCPHGMRRIDALLMSAGANDVGFGRIVETCANPATGCNKDANLNAQLRSDLAKLPEKFSRLNAAIRTTLNPRAVFATEYFSPNWTRSSNGSVETCPEIVLKDGGPFDINGVINADEVVWAEYNVVVPMNRAVRDAALANGWTYVGGIATEFSQAHGYCAADNWIVRIDQSELQQGDHYGAMHPNGPGHDAYARHIVQALIGDQTVAHRETDFDRDGFSDILWLHESSGNVSAWYLGASSKPTTPVFGTPLLSLHVDPAAGWQVAGTADFDGDGAGDVLWRMPSTGQLYIWYMNGEQVVRGADLAPNNRLPDSTGWSVVGTGDFNRDGKADLLWLNSQTGEIVTWLLDDEGTRIIGSPKVNRPYVASAGWALAGTGDFDGDGGTDLLWYNLGGGNLVYWRLDGVNVVEDVPVDLTGPNVWSRWKIVGVDDYNRDGTADVLWHHLDEGSLVVWNLVKGRFVGASGLAYQVPESSGWRVVSR